MVFVRPYGVSFSMLVSLRGWGEALTAWRATFSRELGLVQSRTHSWVQRNRWITSSISTRDFDWVSNSGWLCTSIWVGVLPINKKRKQILHKLNGRRHCAVITKQTSRWDYCFPWAVLLYLIRCDIGPPPRCSAAEWLNQPINHSFITTGGLYCSLGSPARGSMRAQ